MVTARATWQSRFMTSNSDTTSIEIAAGNHPLPPHLPDRAPPGITLNLFARTGPAAATTTDGITDAAIAHDVLMHGNAYTNNTGPTLRRLAALAPQRLALMHGPTFVGDGAAELEALANYFDDRLAAA